MPGVWLAMLVGLLLQVRPPQLLVTLGQQQTVVTRNTLAGVHTRFVDEAEPWKIQRGLEMVREMGAPWIVEFFPWAYYEKSKGQFEWSGAERIIDQANRQGLAVIARLGFVPEWARPKMIDGHETTTTYLAPEHYRDFAEFAAAFAAHFKGRVRYIVVWNEPNLTNEWGMRRVDPSAYVAMLSIVYPALKRANPDVLVLVGALAPTIERNPDAALSDVTYLNDMYAGLARPLQATQSRTKADTRQITGLIRPWDAWALHTYGTTFAPEDAPDPAKINFRRVELLRAVMRAHSDNAPIYITESGWNDAPNWINGVTPAQRIDYTLRALDYAKTHWADVKCVAFWVFKLPAPARGYRDNFTFVTPSLESLPIYNELKRALVPTP